MIIQGRPTPPGRPCFVMQRKQTLSTRLQGWE